MTTEAVWLPEERRRKIEERVKAYFNTSDLVVYMDEERMPWINFNNSLSAMAEPFLTFLQAIDMTLEEHIRFQYWVQEFFCKKVIEREPLVLDLSEERVQEIICLIVDAPFPEVRTIDRDVTRRTGISILLTKTIKRSEQYAEVSARTGIPELELEEAICLFNMGYMEDLRIVCMNRPVTYYTKLILPDELLAALGETKIPLA